MKAYLITTGSLFGLLTIAHVWRVIAEPHLSKDPWYLAITLLAAVLCFWAFRLVRAVPRGTV